jgi:hypothetical protein
MPRIWLCLAIAVTSFAVPSLASTSGEETPDKKDVRELIYQIIDADMKGNSERFLSFMAPEVINYDATPEDPELWWVVAVGLDSLRALAPGSIEAPAALYAKHPDWHRHNEVRHVTTTGDGALAVSQHVRSVTGPDRGTWIMESWKTVWMLRKANGVWKVIGIMPYGWEQRQVFEVPPKE